MNATDIQKPERITSSRSKISQQACNSNETKGINSKLLLSGPILKIKYHSSLRSLLHDNEIAAVKGLCKNGLHQRGTPEVSPNTKKEVDPKFQGDYSSDSFEDKILINENTIEKEGSVMSKQTKSPSLIDVIEEEISSHVVTNHQPSGIVTYEI